jgi:hypothetical protein
MAEKGLISLSSALFIIWCVRLDGVSVLVAFCFPLIVDGRDLAFTSSPQGLTRSSKGCTELIRCLWSSATNRLTSVNKAGPTYFLTYMAVCAGLALTRKTATFGEVASRA